MDGESSESTEGEDVVGAEKGEKVALHRNLK